MESLQYSLSPGAATSRMANSLWNINTAHLNKQKTQTSGQLANVDMKNSIKQGSFLPEEGSMQKKLEDKRRRNLRN